MTRGKHLKAAIDIGSNGIRLVIAPISEHGKLKTFRAPVRLGQDVFEDGYISNKSLSLLVDALLLFKKKMHASGVTLHKIVATSAVREDRNKRKVIDEVAKKTQIKICIIERHLEAELIHEAVCEKLNLSHRPTLIMDIGGGSVECIYSMDHKIIDTITKKIGTVRLLSKVPKNQRNYSDKWLDIIEKELSEISKYSSLYSTDKSVFVGTGGNLRAIGKLCKSQGISKRSDKIKQKHLLELITLLSGLSIKERISNLGLRSDRADVILPAALVTEYVMQIYKFKWIKLPDIGLKEGILNLVSE